MVDDYHGNILALEATLAGTGYVIETAASGAEALTKIARHEFAVILLDVIMPIMDGFETARIIRSRPGSRHVPIIFLTAQGSELAAVYKGYAVGAVDYLVKPLHPDIVRAKVAVFADLYRQAQRIRRQEEELRQAEQRRSQAALRDSEALFEATFDQAAIGIAHATLDGRWTRINRRLCEILGWGRDRLPGQFITNAVHASNRVDLQNDLAALASGKTTACNRECRLIKEGGEEIWAEVSVSVLCDEGGTPKTLIVVVEDVCERKWAEQRQAVLAAASEMLLSSLEPAATLDNVARLTVAGFAQWCVIALHGEGKVAVAHRDGEQEADLRAFCQRWPRQDPNTLRADGANGQRPTLVTPAMMQGRSPFDVEPTARALLDRMGNPWALVTPIVLRQQRMGLLVLAADARQRPFGTADLVTADDLAHRLSFALDNGRLYREAQEAIGARDEFLSIASHELRTPLTPLQIQIEMLLRQSRQDLFSQPERLQRIVDRSQRQVRRLETLIDNLLDVSRAAAGRLQMEFETVELGEVVREVAARFADELAAAGSELTVETAPAVIGKWDRVRLEQVVTNLVGNAIKYGSGRPIAVRLDSTPDQARLRVQDHGIGIEPDKIGRLFERFERAVPSRSYGGLGLGLYIARQIVEGHHGVIRVESSLGEGSTFTVELPRSPSVPVTAAAANPRVS
ncbi:MAG TPA: ATP-binding protein [Polyangia bacterium]|nr:ATP-binding protein [Polyangia bacterium]